MPPPGMKAKRRIQPNVPLPMLNWVPLRKINETIFDELDDERVLQELNFSEVSSPSCFFSLPPVSPLTSFSDLSPH
jgi:hypothetical protein